MNCELFSLRLEDNPYLVCLILLFVVINILSWSSEGVMRLQIEYLHETRNARSFAEVGVSTFNPMRPLLLLQFFIFSGLSLFYSLSGCTPTQLAHPDTIVWIALIVCICIPIGWSLFQWFTFNWTNYLFGDNERIQILNRLYGAIHILASPVALFLFMLATAGFLTPFSTLVLLTSLFILCQGVFIFYGFKIFLRSFSSLCFIILYLCTLEIAPILIFWHKMSLSAPTI